MANTTISQLTPIVGTDVAATDSFIIYDVSANTEKQITSAELKSMVGNGSFTFTTSSASDALVITSTDSGSTGAPDIVFYRNSASPANGDDIGNIVFRGKNSAGDAVDYAQIWTEATTVTGSAESGSVNISTRNAGTLATRLTLRSDGGVSLGGTSSAGVGLYLRKDITGAATSYGAYLISEIESDVTTAAYGFRTAPKVADSAFTLPSLFHYGATAGTIGAAATVTNQYGFISNALIGANNNYGVYVAGPAASTIVTGKTTFGVRSDNPIATGGGASWNFYAGGTAPSYFLGNVGVNNLSATEKLDVVGNIKSSQQIYGGYTAHANGTTAMALGTNTAVKVTPTATATFTTTVAPAGSRASVIILTSGTTSYTITFGTGFKTTGTLATGTTTARTFVIEFISDGTSMIEASRTAAMA